MILHRLKYECRGQDKMLVIWGVVLVAYLVSGVMPGAAPLVVAVPLLAFTLALILVVSVVTADPPAGTEAFWMTRPVRGDTLAMSKLLFLALVVVLPWMLVEIVVLLGNGAGAAAFWVVPDFLARRLPWLLAAMAAACLTTRMDQTAMVVGLGIVGLALLAAIARLAYDSFASTAGGIPGVAASKTPAALVTGALGWSAVLVYQYRRRRGGRGAAGLAVSTATAGVVYLAWPWDVLTPAGSGGGDWAWFESAPGSIDPSAVRGQPYARTDGRGVTTRIVSYQGRLGVPQTSGTMMAEPRVVDGRFEVEGAAWAYRRYHAWRRTQTWSEDRALRALLEGLGLRPGEDADGGGSTVVDPLFEIPAAEVERFEGALGNYRAEWTFDGFAYQVRGEIPLRAGGRLVTGGLSVQVEGFQPRFAPVYESGGGGDYLVGRRLSGCRVAVSDRVPNLSVGARNPHWLHRAWNGEALLFLLVNRERKEVAFPGGASSNTAAFPVGVQRVRRSQITFDLPAATGEKGGPPGGDGEHWLEGASILVVERAFLGRRTKKLAFDGFRL